MKKRKQKRLRVELKTAMLESRPGKRSWTTEKVRGAGVIAYAVDRCRLGGLFRRRHGGQRFAFTLYKCGFFLFARFGCLGGRAPGPVPRERLWSALAGLEIRLRAVAFFFPGLVSFEE